MEAKMRKHKIKVPVGIFAPYYIALLCYYITESGNCQYFYKNLSGEKRKRGKYRKAIFATGGFFIESKTKAPIKNQRFVLGIVKDKIS
ncbi:MAG: hypothetical protein KH054_07200 [Firmicutes bacterium]|nr:hypothetical protein [Bacillota bacterium]